MATALCQTKIWFGLPTSRNTRIKLFIDYVIPLVKLIAAKYRDEAVNFFFSQYLENGFYSQNISINIQFIYITENESVSINLGQANTELGFTY